MPKISVIVPIYKVEAYLSRCVDSILAQTFTDFDLVLVDDGSPDNCPKMCDDYAKRDNRIVAIHKLNGGLSDARNAGIDWAFENSDSQWLAFVDSDDYLHEDYLKKLYNACLENGADLAICDFVRVGDDERRFEDAHDFDELVTEDKNKLFEYMYVNWRIRPAWNKLYSKTIFNELRFEFGKIHEDEFAIHHVLNNSRKTVIIEDGLYYYRTRENSIVATESPKTRLDGMEAILEQYEFCTERSLPVYEYTTGIAYMDIVLDMKNDMDEKNMPRYKALKKRYEKMFFAEDKNKNIKRLINFHCPEIYKKVMQLCGRS